MSVTGGIIAGVGAAASLGGAAMQSSAAQNAAQTQAAASEQAAKLQYQAEQQSLAFQNQVWQQQQQNIAPWLQSGAGALTTLDQLMGLNAPNVPANYGQPIAPTTGTATNPVARPPLDTARGPMGAAQQNLAANLGGINPAWGTNPPAVKGTALTPAGQTPGTAASTMPRGAAPGIASGQLQPFAPWTQQFQAPPNITEQNDPGYQFRMQQGEQALQNSAAASGDLLSGNTLAALTQYGQNFGSNEYQNVYNRALQQYQQQYNIYENNQANQYNRLAALAGVGQTAANQLNSAGSTAAGQYGNTVMGTAGNIGNYLQNAAAANASGYVGAANAWGGAVNNIGNLGSMIPYLQMLNQGGGGAGAAGVAAGSAGDYNATAWGG